MTVLCLVESEADRAGRADPAGGIDDSSARALALAGALARSSDEDLAAAWFGEVEAVTQGELLRMRVDRAFAIASGELSCYAPLAWARALAGLAAGLGEACQPHARCGEALASTVSPVSAVIAAATDRGNEVLAHLGAITGLPMAANCVSASRVAPGQCRLVRQRWGGSLLEQAVLDAPLALLTVAADAVPAGSARATGGGGEGGGRGGGGGGEPGGSASGEA